MNKRDPKAIFRTVFWTVFILLTVAFSLSLVFIDRWFFGGKSRIGGYGGVMMIPSMLLASIVATTVCRRMGISRDNRSVEIIKRGCETPPLDSFTAFEMRYPRSIWAALTWMTAPLSLLILILVSVVPSVPGTEIYAYWMAAGFALAAIGCWIAYLREAGFTGSVDEQGIKGYDSLSVKVKSIKWSEIEGCEVTVIHDALGRLAHPFFVFKGKDGKVLLKMLTSGISAEQTTQFKAGIEHYLSRAE